MCGGFIKLHRKITEWEWFTEPNTFLVFVHLLFMANWKDGRFQGVEVPRGSLITSVSHLALRTRLSVRQTRTALSNLQMTNEIAIKTTNRFSFITVNNYGFYQGNPNLDDKQIDKVNDKQMTNERQTNDKRTTTIEEYKNIRNKELLLFSDTELPVSKTTTKTKKFVKPTIEEISAYCAERNNNVDPQRVLDYYESNGWKVGKNPMQNWKATVRTWEHNNFQTSKQKSKYDVLDNLDLDSNPFDF